MAIHGNAYIVQLACWDMEWSQWTIFEALLQLYKTQLLLPMGCLHITWAFESYVIQWNLYCIIRSPVKLAIVTILDIFCVHNDLSNAANCLIRSENCDQNRLDHVVYQLLWNCTLMISCQVYASSLTHDEPYLVLCATVHYLFSYWCLMSCWSKETEHHTSLCTIVTITKNLQWHYLPPYSLLIFYNA